MPEVRGPRDVKIAVKASALNHLDLFVVEGLPGVTIRPPWVMGADAMGIVEDVGADVTRVKRGDPVIINPGISDRSCEYCLAGEHSLCLRYGILGEHHPGTMAEFIVVPEYNVRPVRTDTPVVPAAAYTLVTLTAWHMLVGRAGIQPGDSVLIQGIGGGVALAALGIARMFGARTWATSTSDAKLDKAREHGADFTLNSTRDDVARLVREQTGKRGIDIVVDNVGAVTWRASLAVLGKRGRLVTCGGTSGPVVQSDVRRLFWNQQSILGSTMGTEAEFDAITQHFLDGKLSTVVDSVFDLADGRAAFERLASREHFGKVVVTI